MINFGFSAFLKILSLNEKPHKTEIRHRVIPSTGEGYDFHRSLRLHARRYLLDGATISEVLASAETITRASERLSAIGALKRLEIWREKYPQEIVTVPTTIFESPGGLFRVKFQADFGLRVSGKTIAIHIWNTKHPLLAAGAVYSAMTLVSQGFEGQDNGPDDIGVLSLREPSHLYQLSEVSDQSALAASFVDQVEETIRNSTPPPPPPGHHPPPP